MTPDCTIALTPAASLDGVEIGWHELAWYGVEIG